MIRSINRALRIYDKYLIAVSLFISANCRSQKLEIVPNLGIHYHGISYISNGGVHPEDFKPSRPELEGTWGFDLKYRRESLTHLLSIQDVVLGSSFPFGIYIWIKVLFLLFKVIQVVKVLI